MPLFDAWIYEENRPRTEHEYTKKSFRDIHDVGWNRTGDFKMIMVASTRRIPMELPKICVFGDHPTRIHQLENLETAVLL